MWPTCRTRSPGRSGFGGSTVNGYGVWTPQVCQYVQDDALAFLSPEIYTRFVFPPSRRRSPGASIRSSIISIPSRCSSSMSCWNRQSRILEINREPEAIGPSMKELLPAFRKTLRSNKCLLINFTQGAVGIALFEEEVALICGVSPVRGPLHLCHGETTWMTACEGWTSSARYSRRWARAPSCTRGVPRSAYKTLVRSTAKKSTKP